MSKFTKEFIKNYDEDINKGYTLEVNVKYPKKLHDLHSDLPFSPERMKIDKCKNLVCNLYNKKKYVVYIRSLKQALNHGLIFKKVHRVIQFNQEAWLKSYINMNTELRKKAKNDFEKDFLDMLLMVEEGIRGGICHSIHRHAKANNKHMKNYDENEESSYIQYLDANNLYGWAMSQKLPVNGFKWIENNEINEEFIKNYDVNNEN